MVQNEIFQIRGVRVMLAFDLAKLYMIEARILNQSLKRNIGRSPSDFMFQLSLSEWNELVNSSQFVMSSLTHRGIKYSPFALHYLLSPKSKTSEIGFKQNGRKTK